MKIKNYRPTTGRIYNTDYMPEDYSNRGDKRGVSFSKEIKEDENGRYTSASVIQEVGKALVETDEYPNIEAPKKDTLEKTIEKEKDES